MIYQNHTKLMTSALAEARKAAMFQEVPVGAVLADENGEILSAAFNQVISLSDPTAHAEILALRKACQKIGNYRLLNTTLYVTIEPCVMCMGAMIHARVSRIVFGAADPKWGAAGSLYDLPDDARLNHHPEIIRGILEAECRNLIQNFFRAKRKNHS